MLMRPLIHSWYSANLGFCRCCHGLPQGDVRCLSVIYGSLRDLAVVQADHLLGLGGGGGGRGGCEPDGLATATAPLAGLSTPLVGIVAVGTDAAVLTPTSAALQRVSVVIPPSSNLMQVSF
jgi:hypothetical protein